MDAKREEQAHGKLARAMTTQRALAKTVGQLRAVLAEVELPERAREKLGVAVGEITMAISLVQIDAETIAAEILKL